MANTESMLADAILVAHLLFIVFVVAGQGCVLIGAVRRWRWIRRRAFRVAHLAAIAFVALESWVGAACPLTVWEDALRAGAGDTVQKGTFIGRWVSRIVFYEAPPWAFTAAYTLFGLVVLTSWFLVRPVKGNGAKAGAAAVPQAGPPT